MKKNKLLVLLILFGVFITLGMPDSLINSSWNQVRMDFEVKLSYLGLITFVSYLMIISSIGFGPRILMKFSEKQMAFIGIVSYAFALLVIAIANSFWIMLLCAIPIGLGRGLLDYSVNHYMSIHYKAKEMNYLHSMFGFGVVFAPFVMAYTLRDGNWRLGFLLIGGLLLLISLFLLFSFRFFDDTLGFGTEEHHQRTPLKELLKVTGVKETIVMFILITHIESLGSVWIASYFFLKTEMTVSLAATFTSTYFIGLTTSRFLSGIFSDYLKPDRSLKLGFLSMFVAGLFILMSKDRLFLSFFATFLLGFGAGPSFPNMMNINANRFQKKYLSQLISLEMGIGFAGFGLLTPMLGYLIDTIGPILFPIEILIISVLLLLMFAYLNRVKPLLKSKQSK